MNIASIRDLQLFQFGVTIRVRVYRTWRPKVFKSDDQFSGLQCILVDTMYESQLGSHPIASGELGYEIQIREAVVHPNCLTILRFKEQLFGISCYQLVVEKGFTNQEEFPDAILQVRGQYRLFQLRFGAIKNDLNRSDLLIQAVFDDIEPLLKSSSNPFDQALVQYEKKDTPGQIFPSTPPPLSKETSTPLTASFTSSPNESMSASKKKARIAVKKKLFTSLIQTQKKFKIDDTTDEKTETIHAAKGLDKDVSDSDDAPLISLKTKIASANVGIIAPKKEYALFHPNFLYLTQIQNISILFPYFVFQFFM